MSEVLDAIDALVNEMINTESAPNYKGWIVSDENTGNEYVITVQLKDGETPSEQLATAKAEIEKLSPLVEIVSNQNQRIQQLEEALIIADKWLDIDAQYYGSPVCNKIKNALPKYKADKPSVISQFEASISKAKTSPEQQLAAAKAEIAEMMSERYIDASYIERMMSKHKDAK